MSDKLKYEQNGHVVTISATAAAGYARAGYTTMLDGIYGPWFLGEVRDATAGLDLHYVVLRCDVETSVDRACNRAEVPAPEAVVRKMHGDFDQLAQYEPFVVDTTSTTPDEARDEVVRRFEAGELRLD